MLCAIRRLLPSRCGKLLLLRSLPLLLLLLQLWLRLLLSWRCCMLCRLQLLTLLAAELLLDVRQGSQEQSELL